MHKLSSSFYMLKCSISNQLCLSFWMFIWCTSSHLLPLSVAIYIIFLTSLGYGYLYVVSSNVIIGFRIQIGIFMIRNAMRFSLFKIKLLSYLYFCHTAQLKLNLAKDVSAYKNAPFESAFLYCWAKCDFIFVRRTTYL